MCQYMLGTKQKSNIVQRYVASIPPNPSLNSPLDPRDVFVGWIISSSDIALTFLKRRIA